MADATRPGSVDESSKDHASAARMAREMTGLYDYDETTKGLPESQRRTSEATRFKGPQLKSPVAPGSRTFIG